ncbi:MAG: CRTAC1 family protein [Synechococcales bacterium]|nr:CRTAC1 family protein [Synechococcales bacterium]
MYRSLLRLPPQLRVPRRAVGWLQPVLVGLLALTVAIACNAHEPPLFASQFQEVTEVAGLRHPSPAHGEMGVNIGSSFGAAWGDVNQDGWPDVWTPNHSDRASLFVNQADGTARLEVDRIVDYKAGDNHGAGWADVDNDGDQDLIQILGGQGGGEDGAAPNWFYRNTDGQLRDEAAAIGVDYPQGRGRSPLWFDYNQDGRLDLLQAVELRDNPMEAPTTVLRQNADGTFADVGLVQPRGSEFGLWADLTGDDQFELLLDESDPPPNALPLTLYQVATEPFTDISKSWLSALADAEGTVTDVAIADVNGDLRPDLYVAQNTLLPDVGFPDPTEPNPTRLRARLAGGGQERGFTFTTPGSVTFQLRNMGAGLERFFIGPDGATLQASEVTSGNGYRMVFTLTPDDPRLAVSGIRAHDPEGGEALYLGYDATQQEWQLLQLGPQASWISLELVATAPITNPQLIGDGAALTEIPGDRLLINTENGLVDETASRFPDALHLASENAVFGDFDNDGDVDLYVVTTGAVSNRANLLFANRGDGTFQPVENAAGAAFGSPGISSGGDRTLGVGDTVTTVDFDRDGFLDLFATNGGGFLRGLRDGPNWLFRNQGNGNHWLEIDLQGTTANRDGIGSTVWVTTPDGVTQLRQQDGGAHRFAQNHARLHFGLGKQDRIATIRVAWPSGNITQLEAIAADQVLTITEQDAAIPDLLR